jgi:hypothetical protein
MKVIGATLISIALILTSCAYNGKQKELIAKIEKERTVYVSADLSKELKTNFSQNQTLDLTEHPNPHVRCSFFSLVLDHYPGSIYQTIIDHIADTALVMVHTSYDTIHPMTVAEYMLWKTQKSPHIGEQQRENLNDLILFNYNKYTHLNGDALLILRLSKQIRPKYYNIIRNLVLEKAKNFNLQESYLLYYLARFKKPEDIKIISSVLNTIFKKETDLNITGYNIFDLIRKYPSDEYLPILLNFYSEKIKNRRSRCDECYCEVEQFIRALVAFPSPVTEQVLYDLSDNANFGNLCYSLAIAEHIFFWVRKTNNSYYLPILKSLEKKINRGVYIKISKANENFKE